jgi:hypothetical protein
MPSWTSNNTPCRQTGWESHIDRPTAQAILGTKGYNALFGAMTGHGKLNGLFNSEVPQFGASREQIRSLVLELRTPDSAEKRYSDWSPQPSQCPLST